MILRTLRSKSYKQRTYIIKLKKKASFIRKKRNHIISRKNKILIVMEREGLLSRIIRSRINILRSRSMAKE